MKRILAALLAALPLCANAATVTHAVATGDTTTTADGNASGAFTPASSDLLVAGVCASDTVDTAPTLSSSIGGFTFTLVESTTNGPGANTLYVYVANALVSSAISQTVTFTTAVDAGSGSAVAVYRVSGMTKTGLTAILQDNEQADQGGAATPAVTLGSSVLTGNPTIGFVCNNTNPATVTPPASWTEGGEAGYATPNTGIESVHRNSGFTGTTITWGSTYGSNGGAVAVELDSSASCSGTPTITDVDTDESITATQANVVITGTSFCASQGAGSVTLRDASANSKTLSVDSWSDTSIQVDTSGVGMGVVNGLKYGALDIRVTNADAGHNDDQAITVTAPSGTKYADLSGGLVTLAWDPDTGAPNRIFGYPNDLETTSQLALRNASGCTIATDITINADGSLTLDPSCASADADFTRSGLYVGTTAAQTFAGMPVEFGLQDIADRSYTVDLAISPLNTGALFAAGDEAISSYAWQQLTTSTNRTLVNGTVTDSLLLVVDAVTNLVKGDHIDCGVVDSQIVYVNPFTLEIGLTRPLTCADNAQVHERGVGTTTVSGLSFAGATGILTGTPDTIALTSETFVRATDADSLTADSNPFAVDVHAPSSIGPGKGRKRFGFGIRIH